MKAYPLQLSNAGIMADIMQPSVSMYIHETGDLHVSKAIKEQGVWELFETKLLLACLQAQYTNSMPNFVDVGANLGYYSLIAAASFEHLSVYAFEPEPRNAELLQQNIALNSLSNIHFQQAGLASVSSPSRLYLSEDNFGDHQIYDRGEIRQSVDVQLLNGAEYLCAYIDRIDVLKIDTQGAEYEVITGLMPLLLKSPDIDVVIEFWPFGLKKQGSHGHQLLDLLLDLSRPMYIIDHIDHQLIPCSESDMRTWIDSLDVDSNNEGFMNLFFGNVPNGIKIKA